MKRIDAVPERKELPEPTMPLMPLNSDDSSEDGNSSDAPVTLTGIDVSGGDREQILEALQLNRKMLHEPQPGAEVDEGAVRRTIDTLLDQLNDSRDGTSSSKSPPS